MGLWARQTKWPQAWAHHAGKHHIGLADPSWREWLFSLTRFQRGVDRGNSCNIFKQLGMLRVYAGSAGRLDPSPIADAWRMVLSRVYSFFAWRIYYAMYCRLQFFCSWRSSMSPTFYHKLIGQCSNRNPFAIPCEALVIHLWHPLKELRRLISPCLSARTASAGTELGLQSGSNESVEECCCQCLTFASK